MNTMFRTMRWHLLTVSLSGFLAAMGCGEGSGGDTDREATTTQNAGETLTCPNGQVPFTFASGTATNSEEYIASAEVSMDDSASLPGYSEITISSVTCSDGSIYDAATLESVTSKCDGQRTCTVTSLCQRQCEGGQGSPGCTFSDATIAYTCSSDGGTTRSSSQTSSAESGTNGTFGSRNNLSCRGVSEDLSVSNAKAGRVECIPAQCHGRARRNADMQCVVDDAKIEVVVEATIGTITPAIETMDAFGKSEMNKALSDRKIPGRPMPLNGTYNIPVQVEFANGLVPEEVKFTAWLEDEYIDVFAYQIPNEVKQFRCIAFAFTVQKDDPHVTNGNVTTYAKVIKTKFSEDCDGAAVQKHTREYLLANTSIDTYPRDRDFIQRLHLSYDMEGRTVWHKDLKMETASQLGDSEPECHPNPTDMFYDATRKATNRRAYFNQRLLTTYKDPSKRDLWLTIDYSDRAEIGTIDIVARNEPIVRVFSNRRPSLIVDLSWYLSNMNINNTLNFETPAKRQFRSGMREYLHTPRADVYVVPTGLNYSEREAITPLHLGSVELTDGKKNGKFEGTDDIVTQSASLTLDAVVKQKLTRDTTSDFYITGTSRAFDLFYCINATDGLLKRDAYFPLWSNKPYYYRNETRWLKERQSKNGSTYNYIASYDLAVDQGKKDRGEATNPAHENGPFWRIWSVELENNSMHNPFATPFKYRGCRTAKQPVVIYVDRFKTPVEPTERVAASVPAMARTHTDFSDEQKSGDSSMSGTNDTGSQETCPNNDSSDPYCSNSSKSDGRSDGEGGRPTLDLTTTIERDPPKAGEDYSSVAMKFRGQLAGFSALDMDDLKGAFADMGTPGQSRKLTLNITPNWDNIAELLNGGDPSPSTEWDTGRFGERDGLGYSLGYNLMFYIGPVPVFATIKFTVGASVGLKIEVAVAPEDDDAYACLDETEDCVIVTNTNTSFADAAEDCNAAGGRLTEIQTPQEAAKLRTALTSAGVTSAWIGAQLAYEKDTRVTEYRWLSNNVAFADDAQGGSVTYGTNITIPNKRGLRGYGEDSAAVFYNPIAQDLGAARIDGDGAAALPYACTLPAASEEVYFSWSTGLALGAGAGFGLEGCTPSPFVGFCLSASLNIVNAEITPTVGQVFRWLYKAGATKPFSRNGILSFTIPFTMSLFSGDVKAALKLTLVFFELVLEWTIHEFDGIQLFDINLYELELPVLEDY